MMDPRSTALAALARFQVTETSVGETLHRITDITVEAVSAAAIAGMTMLGYDGQPVTAVSKVIGRRTLPKATANEL